MFHPDSENSLSCPVFSTLAPGHSEMRSLPGRTLQCCLLLQQHHNWSILCLTDLTPDCPGDCTYQGPQLVGLLWCPCPRCVLYRANVTTCKLNLWVSTERQRQTAALGCSVTDVGMRFTWNLRFFEALHCSFCPLLMWLYLLLSHVG